MGVLPSSASVNSGEFAVPLRRVGSLAPAAQVVVYALMASGEAVADSQDFPVQLCLNNKVHLQPAQPPAVVVVGGETGWSNPAVSAGLPEVLLPAGAPGREDHPQPEGPPGVAVLRPGHRPERPPAAGGGGTHRQLCRMLSVSGAG